MRAISIPARGTRGFGFIFAVCASCATYTEPPPRHDSTETSGGSAGAGGAPAMAGSSAAPQAGKAAAGASGRGGGGAGGAAEGGAEAAESGAGGAADGGAGVAGVTNGGAGGAEGGSAGAGVAGIGGKASGGGGSGGSGGQGTTCAKNPISAKATWTVTASHSRATLDPVENANDGVLTNRWSTGKDQAGDEWLQVDFGVPVKLTQVTLILGSSVEDYPRKFAARLSSASQNVAAPVLDAGMGAQGADTVLDFPAASVGRYLLISQEGMATGRWWSVAEIQAECAD